MPKKRKTTIRRWKKNLDRSRRQQLTQSHQKSVISSTHGDNPWNVNCFSQRLQQLSIMKDEKKLKNDKHSQHKINMPSLVAW